MEQNVRNEVKYETFSVFWRRIRILLIKLVPINQKGVIMSKTGRLQDLKH